MLELILCTHGVLVKTSLKAIKNLPACSQTGSGRGSESEKIIKFTEVGGKTAKSNIEKRNTKEIKKFFFSFDCWPQNAGDREAVLRLFFNIVRVASHTSKWMCLDEWKATFFSGRKFNRRRNQSRIDLTSHGGSLSFHSQFFPLLLYCARKKIQSILFNLFHVLFSSPLLILLCFLRLHNGLIRISWCVLQFTRIKKYLRSFLIL